jgi:hypothetical protein
MSSRWSSEAPRFGHIPAPLSTQVLMLFSCARNEFVEMMEIMDKRLNDKGKNWRHVFKTLTLLDYLLHAGSENCVIYFRDNLYVVKTLKEFQYVDEYGKDQGANGEWCAGGRWALMGEARAICVREMERQRLAAASTAEATGAVWAAGRAAVLQASWPRCCNPGLVQSGAPVVWLILTTSR